MRLAHVCLVAAAVAAPLEAQQLRAGLLLGRILDAEGAPVAEAVVRATQGARTILAVADEDGDYRLAGLDAGRWTIAVRQLGYRPAVTDLVMPPGGLRRDFTLEKLARALDPVLVAARWTGVAGIVGDARRLAPLTGAVIRLLGSDTSVGSDSLGRFALPVPGGRAVVLRVERAGFDVRLVSVAVPETGYLELDLPLDTLVDDRRSTWVWRDLDRRLKFATPRAVVVGRDEIARTEAVSLMAALALSGPVRRLGMVIDRRACVFVDGVARPGLPVDAILAGTVEFVEAYPPGTELTRTLALRWPPEAPCGAPATGTRVDRAMQRQTAQFVAVWTRSP